MTARRVAWWLLVVVLAIGTLAAASVGAWQLQIKSRQPPPVVEQPAAGRAATQAASTGTAKVMSYSYDTLDRDFDAASAMLTGDFKTYYQQFTNEVVRPTAQQKALKSTATVARAGVESLTSDAAVILVFVDQSTTTRDQPAPTSAASSVRVGMTKVNGTWLISKFDPV